MKINAGMRVAFWHAGEGTIYEATLTDGKWECVAGLPTLHTHATYTNDNGKKRSIYLASGEMTELPTLERTQSLSKQFAAIFRS